MDIRCLGRGGCDMEHDGCKLCKYENCSMESKECIGCKQNSIDKYKRMTKADRIRSMSDEELAEFILSQVNAKCSNHDCVGADTCYYHANFNGECGYGCEQAIEKWLQSEVEE